MGLIDLKKIDGFAIKEVNSRLDVFYRGLSPHEFDGSVSPADILSKSVAKSVGTESLSILHGLEYLPISIPFYDKVILILCPGCVVNANLADLKKYLDAGLVIPCIISSYQIYSKDFVDLILNYPHINVYELDMYSSLYHTGESPNLCPNCKKKRQYQIVSRLKSLSFEAKAGVSSALGNFLEANQIEIVDNIDLALSDGSFPVDKAWQYAKVSQMIADYNRSYLFSATPQFNLSAEEVSKNLSLISTQLPLSSKKFDFLGIQKEVLAGVDILYLSDIDLSSYLDLIKSERKRLRKVVRGLKGANCGCSYETLFKIKQEFQTINQGILEINRSTRKEALVLSTNFMAGKKAASTAIVLSYLGLGLSNLGGVPAGLIGAGLTGATFKYLDKDEKIEAIFDKATEKLGGKLEPALDKALSVYFGKSDTTIQTWILREKLKQKNKLD